MKQTHISTLTHIEELERQQADFMTWSVFHEYFSQMKGQVREVTRMVLFSQEDSERDTPTAPNVCPGETSSQSSGILSSGPRPSPAIIPVSSTPEGSSVLREKRLHLARSPPEKPDPHPRPPPPAVSPDEHPLRRCGVPRW